ncbi:mitogen-activated protein kinase kinase kinase [Acanthamoeba castellanii str. Neff]|uniref:Mitogen-activated protein kinase kinase kinase n=1 Tax=Acanthamoeba castellanii (strain ATCC 30010 / Neff) TaxID=1257118 RepID=L8H1C2_ACACF|nr:mitogen-activated protein kinase kinase kinase [Acanthamoeba castellanii str. Neff]ELR18558.1 mitogen-activated protein kinase kinase kinase [Acanthamoeba castellanii str. Neff]
MLDERRCIDESPNLGLGIGLEEVLADSPMARNRLREVQKGVEDWGDDLLRLTSAATKLGSAAKVYIGQTYTEKADVYSYAICLAELMTGEDPYQGMEPHIYASYAITNSLRPQLPETLDEKWKELMMACWHEDPELRPDFAEVVAYLDCYLPATSPPAPAPPLPTTQADVGDIHEDEVDDDGDDDDDDASGAGDVVERRSPEAKRPPPSDHKQHGDEAEEAEDSSPQRTHDPLRTTSSSAGYLLALAGEPKDKSGRERRCG